MILYFIIDNPLLSTIIRSINKNYSRTLFFQNFLNGRVTKMGKINYSNGPSEGNDGKPFFENTLFTRDESGNKIYPEKIKKIVEDIMQLNMSETVLITDLLQEKLGISNEQLMPQTMFAPQAGGVHQQQAVVEEEKKEEEKKPEAPKRTSFNIKLTNIPEGNKIKVLKVIRNLKKGMPLMEVKKKKKDYF